MAGKHELIEQNIEVLDIYMNGVSYAVNVCIVFLI